MNAALLAELEAEIAASRAAKGLPPKVEHPAKPKRGMTRCTSCGHDYKRERGDRMTICYVCMPVVDG